MNLFVRPPAICALLIAGLFLLPLNPSSSFAQVDPKRPLKVALVLPGPVSDGTFNSAAAKGIKAAQDKYPNITAAADNKNAFLLYYHQHSIPFTAIYDGKKRLAQVIPGRADMAQLSRCVNN